MPRCFKCRKLKSQNDYFDSRVKISLEIFQLMWRYDNLLYFFGKMRHLFSSCTVGIIFTCVSQLLHKIEGTWSYQSSSIVNFSFVLSSSTYYLYCKIVVMSNQRIQGPFARCIVLHLKNQFQSYLQNSGKTCFDCLSGTLTWAWEDLQF